MAIKIIINYPKTEEGIQLLKERQAEVVAKSLLRILSQEQVSELLTKLRETLLKKAQ